MYWHKNNQRDVCGRLQKCHDKRDCVLTGWRDGVQLRSPMANQKIGFRFIITSSQSTMADPPPPPSYRVEHDLIGDEFVPEDAYYGIQTLRAVHNFDITGVPISHFPQLIRALAMVKKAAALANQELSNLDKKKANAIVAACDEVIEGTFPVDLAPQFPIDLIQGGAGTSTNMNINEVVTNRGLELMGHKKGEYQFLHPNNDCNQGQSTNDVYPTAARLAIVFSDDPLVEAVQTLIEALEEKEEEFKDVIKMGRTQLQDAVPMTLGQEFHCMSVTLKKDLRGLEDAAVAFSEVNMGGTAIGTGLNTDPEYCKVVIEKLAEVTGQPIRAAPSLIESTTDLGGFMSFSSMLRRLAVKLSKISSDLRLLSSGPRGGLNDINLPPMQPGSSIMPGKVNPVIPEAVNQMAFQVIGNDLTVTMAAEHGQLQLNAFEPVIIYNILSSIRMMTNACTMLTERCIRGITANVEYCESMVKNSIGIVTAFSPFIGYEKSSALAKEALMSGGSVLDLIEKEGLLSPSKIEEIMKHENLTGPSSLISQERLVNVDRTATHLRETSTVGNLDLGSIIAASPAVTANHKRISPSHAFATSRKKELP